MSTLQYTTLIRRCSTLYISTLKYTTLFQCWFDIVPRRDVASTKRQRWNNVEMFAGLVRSTEWRISSFNHWKGWSKTTWIHFSRKHVINYSNKTFPFTHICKNSFFYYIVHYSVFWFVFSHSLLWFVNTYELCLFI